MQVDNVLYTYSIYNDGDVRLRCMPHDVTDTILETWNKVLDKLGLFPLCWELITSEKFYYIAFFEFIPDSIHIFTNSSSK